MKLFQAVFAVLLAMFASLSQAAISTSAIVTDIGLNQVQLLLLGVAVLTCVYALRAVSWGRKI